MSNITRFTGADKSKDPLMNDEAERHLIGALLTRPDLLSAVPDTFDPEHYSYADHAEIHRTLIEIGRPGEPALLQVLQALAINDRDRRAYISALVMQAIGFTPGIVRGCAKLVTELYRRRQVVALSEEIRADAYANAGDGSVYDGVSKARIGLDNLLDSMSGRRSFSLNEAMDLALAKADAACARGGGIAGLSTGFPSIDYQCGGLEDGTLTILAGRPGTGKSALGNQMAVNVAKQGIGVLQIALEMTAAALGRRTLSAYSGVPASAMRDGRHASYVDRLIQCRRELGALPMTIEDGGGMTANMITNSARAAQDKHGLGLIVVDHLHIMASSEADAKQGPTAAMTKISGQMKQMAKEFGCPVLLLAQLNRGVENRDDKRPGMADLRQSGSIEQDADNIAFLYRQELYLKNEPERTAGEGISAFEKRLSDFHGFKAAARGKADLIFDKVREGETGTVKLRFDGETTSFSELGA